MECLHMATYKIADIPILMTSDETIRSETFTAKFKLFKWQNEEATTLRIFHHFNLPEDIDLPEDKCVYNRPPWHIYKFDGKVAYEEGYILEGRYQRKLLAIWSGNYATGNIYHVNTDRWNQGGLEHLTCMPTDQLYLASLLSYRQGFIVHAGGVDIDGKGFIFIGSKGTGKSSTIQQLMGVATVLCDDRVALRMMPDGPRIYGTWCNRGMIRIMSPASAPLQALCFVEQADTNEAIPITDPQEILRRLLPRIVKPLADTEWWEKTLAIVDELIHKVPAYLLRRDLSGNVVDVLRNL